MDGLRKTLLGALLIQALLGFSPASAQSPATSAEASAELEKVRERIEDLRDELESDGRRRSRAEKALAKIEQEEQQIRRELKRIRGQLKENQDQQRTLEAQLERQQAELDAERAALSQQLRIAYINGDEEWLRVVLNQQDATTLGRRMAYYGYFSRQRATTIEKLGELLLQLDKTREDIASKARELAKLEDKSADKLESIADTRGERARLVAKIKDAMAGKGAEIETLTAQSRELKELVEALARVMPAMPDFDSEPFAGQASKLVWPVKGNVAKRFGQPRADGRLKWEGVLLTAKAGADVRSVYHGRVVFSDWLDGMGLLIIIEHGDGYMSLYGHNQDLLRAVGEWVEPNQVIAHVGDSGGKAATGLYFEIRKDGKPVNPGNWIR